jgi:hypothetical protein
VTHHRRAVRAALDEHYFGLVDEPHRARIKDLSDDLQDAILINANEWLLGQALLTLRDGRRVRAIELVLGPGGPLLLAEQRAYLETLAVRPLGLYEVRESRPDSGLMLKNLLDESEREVWVNERSGSRQLVQWDVIGARLVFVDDGWQLSGGVYPFKTEEGARLLKAINELLRDLDLAGAKWHSKPVNDAVADIVIGFWLSLLTTPRPIPMLVDAGTGDPLMLVTDHYEVLDWDRLAAALESQPDVEGGRKKGWTRFVEVDGESTRSILAINIGKKSNRIEPFARTLRLADDGRSWLERIAGDSLRYLTREITDPRSPAALEDRPRRHSAQPIKLSREEDQRMYEHIYRDWADQPIPALGDRSPREALRSRAGRAKVIALLKEYESTALHRAQREGEHPVDFKFMWRMVGLDREALTRS